MKSKFWLVFVSLLVVMVAVAVGYKFWFSVTEQPAVIPVVNAPVVNAPAVNPLATYNNDQFGFQLSYAKELAPETAFKQFYALSSNWRAYSAPDSKGTPVVSIPVFRIDHGGVATGQPYPLYFSTEVRIGLSSDPKDVASCLQNDAGFTDQKVSDVVINGIPFKQFEIGDAAMMQYVKGVSYRTVHNNQCYAIEQLKAGSIYTDPTMTPGYTEDQLNAFYQKGDAIVKTFTFTK